ncbi:Tim44/TimA family putative adaptor protein [Asaia krungthepensis]|uniref:Mitochondrial import inner membrane translocase subunit Tim44 n=1 Tax=Asaia krungthepensis NRIC 0535 TaxID=1307925 RepID=A0ABQ0Q5P3_9PROT|nr:Tim44/TimA family putative adaptor protein [Asaia krungthepensis]GBQ92540.1 mitochondrial import inner membrane translocase subunit Tim44 [Asaia krungthepensis NRIC 0535]
MSVLSNIPYDIVIFALLTLVLVWRLRAVLGRRVDVEGQNLGPVPVAVRQAKPEPAQPVAEEPSAKFDIPQPATRVGQVLAEIANAQPGFKPDIFLQNAQKAFREVVTAFAMGDRAKLRTYLTPGAFAGFDAAITEREAAQQQQRTEIVGLNTLAIIDAFFTRFEGHEKARIDVQIVSRQISILNDQGGQPLVGTESVTEFSDLWQFESEAAQGQAPSSWHLAAARAA